MASKQKNPLLKPVLKWVGGKRQLLADISPLIPSSPSLYVEPFVGGAAVLLSKQPAKARINDANKELINVYRVIKRNPDKLLEQLAIHAELNSSDYYYEIRALDRSQQYNELTDFQKAARIIYLNKTCYNGMFRVNSQGQINVPYGKYKHPNIVNEPGIRALSAYLANDIEILCGDYADALIDLPKNSFVYLDPPYMPISSTSAFTGYTESGFDFDEQVRLRDECAKLREQGISFLQSNSDCEAVRDLYRGFKITTVQAKRSINSKGSGRGAINEVLISG